MLERNWAPKNAPTAQTSGSHQLFRYENTQIPITKPPHSADSTYDGGIVSPTFLTLDHEVNDFTWNDNNFLRLT